MSEKNRLPPIKLGAPGEDISKKDLRAIIQRFKNLHLLQQKKIQNFLQPRQRVFLNLLPLLFHQNVPLLPGFISTETPAGIPDYKPSRQTLNCAGQFSKSFTFKSRALPNYPIWGLYLMGSVSSIAFSKTSDMDIWLCHQPGLTETELSELQQKANAIERWAQTLDLEVHFFLIDSVKFKNGQDTPISSESSGTTQHYLLLEEFYRTAVYIAGRAPAWWVVPPHQDQSYSDYIRHLIDHRFILEQELIDFGSLESVPAEEFITVTLWHLYKAINSPHKSLLKLLLMECYASEYPDTGWLCSDMKQSVYQGDFTIEDLDPYLLIQQKLENYLTLAHSSSRIELARQSFYLKIIGFENAEKDPQKRFCRAEFIKNMAHRWNWPDDLLLDLSRQKSWGILKANHEHALIIRHLSECYRMIVGFASRHVHSSFKENEDLKLIGRKLHSFLEKKPGKIELISTQSILQVKEDELSLVETRFADNRSGWGLFIGRVNANNYLKYKSIKNSWSLLELLAWVVANGLYHRKLQLHLDAKTLKISDNELRKMAEQIYAFITSHLPNQHHTLDHYRARNRNLYTLIIINMGEEPESARDDGMLLMSERSDPLSYGKNRQNFILTLDRISISNWGEITTHRLFGLDGLFSTLADIINHNRTPLSVDDLTIVCNTSARAKSISQRVQNVFQNLLNHLISPDQGQSPRYFLAGGQDYYIFQRKNNAVHYWSIHGQTELMNELGLPQEHFSPTEIDPGCLDNNVIPTLYKTNRPHAIQIFFQAANNSIQLYIIDEKGSLFTQQYPHAKVDALLNRYRLFLENIITRNFFDAQIEIDYYEIHPNMTKVEPYSPIPAETSSPHELNIRVSGEQINNASSYTLYCNENEFSTLAYGNQVINAAAQYILKFRQSRQNYPIHISDIDLPPSTLHHGETTALQTIHFLKYKKKIEDRLNSVAYAAATASNQSFKKAIIE
ncbi:MAG: class I adenylate cyclase [Gammaproteobacteria bacterium]